MKMTEFPSGTIICLYTRRDIFFENVFSRLPRSLPPPIKLPPLHRQTGPRAMNDASISLSPILINSALLLDPENGFMSFGSNV